MGKKQIVIKNTRRSILLSGIVIIVILSLILAGFQVIFPRQDNKSPSPTPTPTPTPAILPTPTPQTFLEKITVIDGNIVLIQATGIIKILIDKNDFQSPVINRFAQTKTSPDQKKICFLGYVPGSIWLYWANIDGTQVTKIGQAKNCVWSHSSQKITYNDYSTSAFRVDVYIYDLTTGENKNLTKGIIQTKFFRLYESPQWSSDDQKITSNYVEMEPGREENKKRKTSVIDLDTGKITDFEGLPPYWPY